MHESDPLPSASPGRQRALPDRAVSRASSIVYVATLAGERAIRFISPNVEAITGYAASAFLDDASFGRRQVHPDDLPAYLRSFGQLCRQGTAVREYRFRSRDGTYRWYRDDLHLTGGETDAFVGCISDITERVQGEQESPHLAGCSSGVSLRQVLEVSPVALVMHRAEDGTILYESPAVRALFQHAGSQVGQSVVRRWASPDDYHRHVEEMRRSGVVEGLDVRCRKATGEEFWCALSARLADYHGQEVVVSTLFDLTSRRETETEQVRQRELLHQSEKLSALGELLAGVSHELNNPFSVLIGQSLLLTEKAPDGTVAARAEKIGKAAERCARIVKNFLDMARLEPSEMALVDPAAVIENALERASYDLRSSEVEVSLRIAKTLPPIVADVDQLRQVIANLITNAKDALRDVDRPRRLRITASYRKQTDQVVVKVKDNGPGVPAEIGSRVFEPLYTTKDSGNGTGIGLALCHRIVEAHCGTIALERSQGEGAVFAVRLPVAKARARPAGAQWRGRRKEPARRILVVDDDDDVVAVISEALARDGHTVDTAISGYLALQKAKRWQYDVILSNIRVPGMDGAGFYRALSDLKPGSIGRLAFIAGGTLGPQDKAFLDASERPLLQKPFSRRAVRELVDLLIRPDAR